MPVLSVVKNKSGFYEKAVLNLVSKMNRGSLSLYLPDGQHLEIGDGKGEVKAVRTNKDLVIFNEIANERGSPQTS